MAVKTTHNRNAAQCSFRKGYLIILDKGKSQRLKRRPEPRTTMTTKESAIVTLAFAAKRRRSEAYVYRRKGR
jgi:hypothetical protein